MIFQNIPSGERVFLDANVFILHFGKDPTLGQPCERLLIRIENQDLHGFTSAHVLSEVAHRLMGIEAHNTLGWAKTGMAQRLRRHPTEVQKLSEYRRAIDEISLIGVQILPVSGSQVSRAADFSRQWGLLSSDSLIVAVMREHGLDNLASTDRDFDRVSGITRHTPV